MRVTHSRFTTVGLVSLALGAILAPTACGDGEVEKLAKSAGGSAGTGSGGKGGQAGQSGQSGEAGQAGMAPAGGFPVLAAAAQVAATLKLDAAIADVVELGELTIGLNETSGASILDFSDPANPVAIAPLATTGAAVAAALDAVNHIAYVLSASGDLRAWQVADPTHPVQAAKIKLGETAALSLGRVAERLFVLGKKGITPVSLSFSGPGAMNSFAEEAAVKVSGTVRDLQVGAGQLYVSKAGGTVEVYSADAAKAPKSVDSYELGQDIVGWVARGTQVFAAVKDVGLKVLDFAERGNTKVVYEAIDEVSDVQVFKRSGNMAVIGLARGLTLALDVSTLSAPRALVSQAGALPNWIAASHGNFVLGSGKSLSVLGVPPFVSASVPSSLLASFPRYGRIPLQLSKAVNPKTLVSKNVELSCGGSVIATTLAVNPDNARVTLLPTKTLPAGSDCSVRFNGVTDTLGLPVSSPGSLGITTSTVAPGAVMSPKSSYPHKADGAFTDWQPGTKGTNFEYGDVGAAQGMYSKFYADYDGSRLWILNDWSYNGDAIEPDCYNQFEVYTGDYSQSWDIRAYGDQHIEVRLNGQLLAADDPSVTGGYSHAASPNDANPHTVYEISVKTKPGAWSLQLSDPGPTFACNRLETDPTSYDGASAMDTTSVDPTKAPTTPAKPSLGRADTSTLTPTLTWSTADAAGSFTIFLLELSHDQQFTTFFKQWVYGQTFTIPAGLLMYDTAYSWRVTGYNLAGTTPSSTGTFTVPSPVVIVAPAVTGVQPTTVTQSTATTLNVTGTGFVQAAQGFLTGADGTPVALSTMFETDTSLQVMLTAANTAVPGSYELTIQNSPDDTTTASKPIVITVTAAVDPTGCNAHDECTVGANLGVDCSPCTTDVCADTTFLYCCQQTWDQACADRADSLKTCTCTVTGSAGATGSGGNAGAAGSVTQGGSAGSQTQGAGGVAGVAATSGAGGSAGMSCSANCADAYPLGSGPPVCDDPSLPIWQSFDTCVCITSCSSVCSLACTNMVAATYDSQCMSCITTMCTEDYGYCVSDGS